jgi:PIN domain nuclease of toxin-antitoxin system
MASTWEMAIKVGIGKWPGAALVLDDFEQLLVTEQFRILPITIPHVRLAGLMPSPHRDPFDRLLAAPASIEG